MKTTTNNKTNNNQIGIDTLKTAAHLVASTTKFIYSKNSTNEINELYLSALRLKSNPLLTDNEFAADLVQYAAMCILRWCTDLKLYDYKYNPHFKAIQKPIRNHISNFIYAQKKNTSKTKTDKIGKYTPSTCITYRQADGKIINIQNFNSVEIKKSIQLFELMDAGNNSKKFINEIVDHMDAFKDNLFNEMYSKNNLTLKEKVILKGLYKGYKKTELKNIYIKHFKVSEKSYYNTFNRLKAKLEKYNK